MKKVQISQNAPTPLIQIVICFTKSDIINRKQKVRLKNSDDVEETDSQ